MPLQSCKDCEPTPSSDNSLQVTFYRYDSLITYGTRVAYELNFAEVSALGTGTVFYNDSDTQSAFSLPLSNIDNSTSFTFLNNLSVTDTFQVAYNKKVIINGPDCGLYETYQDVSIHYQTFDSSNIVKNTIELGDDLHIELFY